ncbi:MAG: diguanylate cyclase [Sulfuricurvum sp.]|uniref:sensor domain-containing diguanylate cyclase n=1 Tax=Sulfuricurvum sp. TaxID=2025608 RepID=UPI0025E77C6E|nr:diguanylate cyclase [Sulfuricurvum sp.]MBV5320417.1 diguanylate cyclase [Sulfuricurvum sp.]
MTTIQYPNILLDTLELGSIIIDEDFNVLYWNQWLELNTGISSVEIIGKNLSLFYPDIDYNVLKRKIRTSLRLNSPTFYDATHHNRFIEISRTKITTSSLKMMQLQITISPYVVEESLVMISIYDISDLHELKLSLQDKIKKIDDLNRELYQDQMIIDVNLMIVKINDVNEILDVTKAFINFFGYEETDLIGSSLSDMFGEDFNKRMTREPIDAQTKWSGEIKVHSDLKGAVWLDAVVTPISDVDGNLSYTVIFHDITDKKRLELLSITDPLTKLNNRHWFNEMYQNIFMRRHWTAKNSFAVIIADIDHFKKINDKFGHLIGDKALINVAQILSETIRNGDLLARWGGEEFVILLSNVDLYQALHVAEKLRLAVEKLNIEEIGKVTASFGVAVFVNGDNQESLLTRADNALYKAKEKGRNRTESLENLSK